MKRISVAGPQSHNL